MGMVEVNWRPDRRQLRVFGLAAVGVFGAICAWVLLRGTLLGFELAPGAARVVGGVLCAVAALCGLAAAAAPRALKPLYLVLTAVGLPIGFVMSYVILAVVFFGLFTPVALVFRLVGRDSLHRKFDPRAGSYWVPRPGPTPVNRYFRQF